MQELAKEAQALLDGMRKKKYDDVSDGMETSYNSLLL
jgi:hypothetical protein